MMISFTRLSKGNLQGTVTTAEAAAILNRKPQTLRKWACLGTGPIQPIRVYGRLAWRLSDINKVFAKNNVFAKNKR